MLKQLITQALNGFSMKDIPFLFLQLSVSAILALIIRSFWRKGSIDPTELPLLKLLVPIQVIFTTVAIFSLKSPWVMLFLGFISLIPVLGTVSLSLRSKMFYLICLFTAFGCGAVNLAVTVLVMVVIIIPCLYFYKSE